MRSLRPLLLVASLGAVGVLGGCAARHRAPITVAQLERDAVTLAANERATRDTMVERLARRVVARGDHTLDILLLAGGGQHGAYGAGFLRGWRDRPGAPMPQFDLVTGISTGSLQAPFALLGTADALDTLATLYRDATERVAPSFDWLFWLRRTGGVVNTERYERSIAHVVDDAMRDRLRARFREGRQLLIGTTDMDLGVGHIWDIARELDSSQAGLARARSLFVATSAIPGIFPPVLLDGHVHSDGGVISNVLAIPDVADYAALGRRLVALGEQGPVTVRVWLVMNTFTHAQIVTLAPSDRRGISQRSTLLMLMAQQPQIVQRLREMQLAVPAAAPNVRLETRFTAPPLAMSADPAAAKLFDKGWMVRLEQVGFERARGASPFDDAVPSPYSRPAAVPAP